MKSLSRVPLLATPWTAAHQAPPSMGLSRQEYWSGVPLLSPVICTHIHVPRASQGALVVKYPPAKAGDGRDAGSVPGSLQEDSLEKEMAPHSSILAQKIPWKEEPSGPQSMGLQRVRHD